MLTDVRAIGGSVESVGQTSECKPNESQQMIPWDLRITIGLFVELGMYSVLEDARHVAVPALYSERSGQGPPMSRA